MFRHLLRKYYGWIGAALLLLVFLFEFTLSIRQQSLSWDEGDHIFAGYMSWKTSDFGINPEHPPLVKTLASTPLLSMNLKVPPLRINSFFKDEAFLDGRDFLFGDGGQQVADRVIFRARMAASILSLLLGLLVFVAAKEMFGTGPALFSLALLVFEPNMIAHGAYVTTDMGVACFMFATIYTLYRYVKAPSLGRLAALGLAAGLALSAKHSAVVVLPMALILLFTEVMWPDAATTSSRKQIALRLTGAFVTASAFAIAVLWTFYGFRYAARPAGLQLNPPLADYVQGLKGVEPSIFHALACWHIFPESYIYGMADVRMLSNSFPSYIFGQVHAHGVWYYFPVAFIIKSTIAFMAFLLLAASSIALGKFRPRREILFLVVPPAFYMLIATTSGINIGARHILPMYAFLAVLIGGAVFALINSDRRWVYVAGLLLLCHVISTTRSYPVYLAYSNEFWGGPSNTYKYLSDSNTDWAQQLKAVSKYLNNRGVKDCYFAYFAEPVIEFSVYGIPCKPLPTADTEWLHYQTDPPSRFQGTVLISAGTLTGFELGSNVLNPYRDFQKLKPTDVIQHGVFVYDGTFDLRFASALSHVTRATNLTASKQLEAALTEAQLAVQIDPEELQAQMILGDTLIALGRPKNAKPAYQRALAIAKTMEPSVSAEWVPQVEQKLAKI